MDFRQTQDRLFSFAVSAMLTSAVLATAPTPGLVTAAAGPQPAQIMTMIEGARSAGFAGMKDIPAPATVATPAATASFVSAKKASPITPAQVQKLRDLANSSRGFEGTLTAPFAGVLGVGTGDRDVPLRAYSAEDTDAKIFVEFFLLPGDSGYVIVHKGPDGKLRFFRIDKNMNLVSGVTADSPQSKPIIIPAADAPAILEADLTTWAGIADSLGIA